jgi:type I restriction enzyme M protein
VLFEGGAGETVRRELLKQANVHTLLRLPTGIFYAQGVKANVLFFDRKPAAEKPWTEKLWIYDLRTNKHFTLKENPLKRSDLDTFVACYNPNNRHERKESERFKSFTYEELTKRDKLNLDIFWLKDESYSKGLSELAKGILIPTHVQEAINKASSGCFPMTQNFVASRRSLDTIQPTSGMTRKRVWQPGSGEAKVPLIGNESSR